jgi:hypothetical protein
MKPNGFNRERPMANVIVLQQVRRRRPWWRRVLDFLKAVKRTVTPKTKWK